MENFERQIRSLVLHFIELLLKLYPARFRHEFYSEIQKIIFSRSHEAELRGQWPSAVFREIAGLVSSIIQEHWHELRFRKEMIMITANEKPRWSFYFGWVALNVIAIIMAWFIASALISQVTKIVGGTIQIGGEARITEDFLTMYVLPPIIGLLTGIFQYLLLRRYLPHMVWWIAATLVGWSATFFITSFLRSSTFSMANGLLLMLLMLLIGAAIALPQWWMLRQRVRQAYWWPLAYGLGWGMVGLLSLITTEFIPGLLAIILMPAITTAIACWLLLDWLPKNELKSSTPSL